jgi:hypothetical protein
MRFTEYGLIFFAGQQRLTRAQVAKLPQVAAFRLSRPGSTCRARVWPPRMGPRMSLTVRSIRSFYEWSQRTGPGDPSETNLPVFHSPPERGHMPAGGQVRIRDQATQRHQEAGRSQPIREMPATRNPALGSFQSDPHQNPRAAVVSSPVVGRLSRAAWGLQAPPACWVRRVHSLARPAPIPPTCVCTRSDPACE